MAIVGRAKYTHARAKFRGDATRRERRKLEISSVREAHALKLKFHEQTEIRYNSVFSRLSRQNQAFQSQDEAKASIPCKNPHSQKWKRASKQEKTSES